MLTRDQLRRLRAQPCEEYPNRLAYAMKLADVTQLELEAAIGIPQSHISKIKTGRYSRLPLERAREYAAFFGCSIEDLFPARDEVSA